MVRGGLSGVVGICVVLVLEIMADDLSDVDGAGLSNRVLFNRSWRADTVTNNLSAGAVADDITGMKMM